MKSIAVIGCGFGDEGKGMVVDRLAQGYHNSIVVRFNGGQQAGHHVICGDRKHIFSNFGSGSFSGAPTYWSPFCTIDPVGIVKELEVLKSKKVTPTLFIDEKCPVTTPYDKAANAQPERMHQTCGVGFGNTLQREEDHYHLLFRDLWYTSVLEEKLRLISEYYRPVLAFEMLTFINACRKMTQESLSITMVDGMPKVYDMAVFEGAQGLLLDQNFGFFPYVTRSNTGTKNILEMGFKPHVFLVTRAFQTRHGDGFMSNSGWHLPVRENPYEINYDNLYQGPFRKTVLDVDLIRYAISCDDYIRKQGFTLVVTCLDLMDRYVCTVNGKEVVYPKATDFVFALKEFVGAKEVISYTFP